MSTQQKMTDEVLRDEVRGWLADHWRPEIAKALSQEGYHWGASAERKAWLSLVLEGRWSVPRWPEAWHGRELDDHQAKIIEREFALAKAPGSGQDRLNLWANTLLSGGSDALKEN